MIRFFVDANELNKDSLVLTGENAIHAKVLRLKKGEQVIVCDGAGLECLCSVSDLSSDQISLEITRRRESETEAAVRVSVYMAFAKGDKFEHVIQKATELGAAEIIAFPAARCVSRPDEKSLKKKMDRWVKIACAAAEQSGRACVPRVLTLDSYAQALERAAKTDISILLYENEQSRTLGMALKEVNYHSVSLLSGPEGGLELSEVKQAIDAGLQICTLGRRILRCETAPLCALTAVMYDSGEF